MKNIDVVCLNNVCFMYPDSEKYALENINLTITEGEFLAVMGENGAGKTTFCRLINGVIPHLSGGKMSGTVTVAGINTIESSVPQLVLKVGMVLDDPDAQLFTSTVYNEAAFGPENLFLPPEEINQRVKAALEAVGLGGYENRVPSTLSGGEKQRLSIAAALTLNGKILVLDEPLCRLDPEGARDVMEVIKNIRKNQKITVLMAADDSGMMAEHADRVCVLKNGRITALDTAKNIFADNAFLEINGIQPLTDIKKITSSFSSLPYESKVRNTGGNNYAINIDNLSYFYPGGAGIENINLTVYENDFIAIIGNNGCGKTTLLKNITGLLQPNAGDIYIWGKKINNKPVSEISNDIGFVMQNPDTQLFTDSVYNEAAFALKNRRLSKSEIKQRVENALEITGLNDPCAFPHTLNKADRTLLVITCVLAMGCKIIILDEVDVGSDYPGKLKIMNILRNLQKKGYTIIFVTHNMFLAGAYAHRLIKMERKEIIMDIKNRNVKL